MISDTNEEIDGFPIKVFNKFKEQEKQKAQIKDYIEDLIEFAHGCLLSKKQLIDNIRSKFPDLSKSKIELFVKETFDKEKRHPDSKVNIILFLIVIQMRLYAKIEVVERYGGDDQLIANMALILESKRDQEIISRQQDGN